MKAKMLSLTVPLLTVGFLGFAGSASAVNLSNGDVLFITLDNFQINGAGLPSFTEGDGSFFPGAPSVVGNPGDDLDGGADDFFDALFGAVGAQIIPTPDNVVIDNPGGAFADAEPGDLGEFTVAASSTGGFSSLIGQVGNIRSFDGETGSQLDEVNQVDPALGRNLLEIDTVSLSLEQVTLFDLNLPTTAAGDGSLIPAGSNPATPLGFLNFQGIGSLTDGTNLFDAEISLSGQFIDDTGAAGGLQDPTDGDVVTNVSSQSAGIRIELRQVQVPEPSSIIGSIAALGAGLISLKRRKKFTFLK